MFNPDIPCVTRADWTSAICSPGSRNTRRTHFMMTFEQSGKYTHKTSLWRPAMEMGCWMVCRNAGTHTFTHEDYDTRANTQAHTHILQPGCTNAQLSMQKTDGTQIKSFNMCAIVRRTELFLQTPPPVCASIWPRQSDSERRWQRQRSWQTPNVSIKWQRVTVCVRHWARINTCLTPIITLSQQHWPQTCW